MASTITVQHLIDFARSHVKLAPLVGIGSISNEPGLTFANKIKRRIINQNYNWRWNRFSIPSFLTVDGQEDYIITPADFGWLEKVRVELEASTATPKPRRFLDVRRTLDHDIYKGDPSMVAAERSDTNLTIIRFQPIPSSTIWRVYPFYQKKPVMLTALTQTFDPIPDEFQDVLTQFFVAFAYKLVDKRQHTEELAEAERLLEMYKANLEPEESMSVFVPQRSLFLG
jgi:hypothetical protein